MSIPKSERKESKFEILQLARKINDAMLDLTLRDFGVKSRKRNPDYFAQAYQMSEQDAQSLKVILKKYNVEAVPDEYPEWFLEEARLQIVRTCSQLIENIEKSNVYPRRYSECNDRRRYQNAALANLNTLYRLLENIGRALPIDLNKFDQYFEMFEHEIACIKNLRKHDNKVAKAILRKQTDYLKKYIEDVASDGNLELTEGQIDKMTELLKTFRYC